MKSSFRSTLRTLASNTTWLLLERAVSIAVAVSVGLYFVRYLGPHNYGLYSYALGLYAIFATLSKFGLNALVTNETVQDRSRQAVILGSAFTLRMIASVASVMFLNASAYLLMNEALLTQLTLVFSAALLLGPFETITHWFEANVRMRPVAIARSATSVTIGVARLLLIAFGVGLIWFAWLVPVEAMLLATTLAVAYRKEGLAVRHWKADVLLMKRFIHQGMPLFLSAMAVMTYMKIDQVMLGKMSSPEQVGIYSAAVKISEMFYFIPVILSGLLFPFLIRIRKRGEDLFEQAFQLTCDGFAWMALGIAVVISLFSTQIISLAYGAAYLPSAQILIVHVWAGVFVFVEALRSKWFVIQESTRFQLLTTASGAVLNIALNLYLIPRYQGLGAAIATTISYGLAVVFACFFSAQTWKIGWVLTKSLFAPFRVLQTARAFRTVQSSMGAKAAS